MIDTRAITTTFATHLQRCGLIDAVTLYEPKGVPTDHGITASVWVRSMGPTEQFTSLKDTSALLVYTIRLHMGMLTEPQDDIDVDLMRAADEIFAMLSGDFTLGDEVDHVDLMGIGGTPLQAEAGYITHSGTMFRVVDITVPVVIGDAWAQAR